MNNFIEHLSHNKKIKLINKKRLLNIFINDPDDWIRAEVAKQNYGLDTLINDNSMIVRTYVADQGYGLSQLINDKNQYMREEVIYYCMQHQNIPECQKILELYNL